ncbi:MAG: glycosyltransferase [Actinomycetota bacterium]
MRSRIRTFLAVGVIATALDIGIVLTLASWSLIRADVVALVTASVVSYLAHRWVTFRRTPRAAWVSQPLLFTATALVAGIVDIAVLTSLERALPWLLLAKLIAVAVAAMVRFVVYRRILFHEVRREMAERLLRPPTTGPVRLSVVLPAYNEEGLIGETVDAVTSELLIAMPLTDFEIVVCDDGSSDGTREEAAAAGARVVRLEENRGKGAAVRAGVLSSVGRAVVFTDADLAYAPPLILDVLERLEDGWDVVVGSRRHDDTETLVKARRIRELGGRVINGLTHVVLLGRFRDTQCGLKGFRGDVGRTIFERTRIDGFAFDVEIFLIAEQDGLSLTEVPVEVTNRAGSSVRIVGHTIELLIDLVRIRRAAGNGSYRPTLAHERVLAARSGRDRPRD